LHDGQFTHAGHAQIARRANLSQLSALASSGKSKASFRASRLDEEGRYGRSSRNVGRDAVDATMSCAHEVAGRVQTRERSRKACKTNGIDAYGEVVWSWHPLLMLSLAEAKAAQPGAHVL
jgi:hypothetical protein